VAVPYGGGDGTAIVAQRKASLPRGREETRLTGGRKPLTRRQPSKTQTQSQGLPFDCEAVFATEASALSLVESPQPATPPESEARAIDASPFRLDSQNSQTPKVAQFPQPLGVQRRTTGLPLDSQNSQLPKFDSSDEPRYPSRVKRIRVQPRLDRQLIKKVRVECASNTPKPLDLQAAIEDGLRLWLRERAESRLGSQDSQTPTCSSSSSKDLDLTTTTTTVDSQTPSAVLLPGVVSAIAELQKLPHESKFEFEVIHAYAWESHRKGEGINTPDVWAVSNYRTGKHDPLIEMWIERKRKEQEAVERQAAAKAKREQDEREFEERIRREREERAQTGEKPWQNT
jgi:hypothetical protein